MKVRFEFYDKYGPKKEHTDFLSVLPSVGDAVELYTELFGHVTSIMWQLEDDRQTHAVIKVRL